MPSILYLSSRVPDPLIGGDRIRNHAALSAFARAYNVHFVSFAEKKPSLAFQKWASEHNISYQIFIKSKLSFYKNAFLSFFSRSPIQVGYYFFPEVRRYIESIYSDFDLLWASDLTRVAPYFIGLPKPKVLDMHDSKAQIYLNSYRKTRSLFWKVIYYIEKARLLAYEQTCIEAFDKILLVNPYEADFFKRPDKVLCVPIGVDEALFRYDISKTPSSYVAFLGRMDYQANVDAVLWFIENVLPLLPNSLKFVVVGANPPSRLRKISRKNSQVIVTGYVADPYEIIRSALCVVAPMITGGGIQNKVLQAMALGTVNILSPLAAIPLGGSPGQHYLVAETPSEMANLIKKIWENPTAYEAIKKNARTFVMENYSLHRFQERILEIAKEVLNSYEAKTSLASEVRA